MTTRAICDMTVKLPQVAGECNACFGSGAATTGCLLPPLTGLGGRGRPGNPPYRRHLRFASTSGFAKATPDKPAAGWNRAP